MPAPLTLTIAALREYHACDLGRRVDDLRRVMPEVTDDQPVPLRVWWDLPSTSVPDRFWSLRAVEPRLPAQILSVRAACLAARRVLHITREQDRPACEAAIVAAEAWSANPCEETRQAAYAAYSAAYSDAADAARGAAYAAYSADAAAYAAYSAARGAAYAAYSADAAYCDEREHQRTDLDLLLETP